MASPEQLSLPRLLGRIVDCVAVADALDGLLLYGASASILEAVCMELRASIRATGVRNVDQVWLGSTETEDSLWGTPGVPGWSVRGVLVPPADTTRIVTIPDLSRLSLPAARAAVMMLGMPAVRIERRGQSMFLPVRHRWVAALAEEDIGSISRHVIDRFAIRIRVPRFQAEQRPKILHRWLRDKTAAHDSVKARNRRKLRKLESPLPVSDEAVARALSCTSELSSLRQSISLLNLAQALAHLKQRRRVSESGIRDAAQLIGLEMAADEPELDEARNEAGSEELPIPSRSEPLPENQHGAVQQVHQEDQDNAPETRFATLADNVVPADIQTVDVVAPSEIRAPDGEYSPHEYTSLRLPWHQVNAATAGRGVIVGTRRADSLRDLAFTETLLAAAPFQALRRAGLRNPGTHLILRRADLRSYRRLAPAGDLLVLVLDYTSVAGSSWLDELTPFLADAYAARAELCVVKVGARSAPNPLQAQSMTARNILVPSVAAALDEPAGIATPLADGLNLGLRAIQRTLVKGRTTVRTATLVVVTDGRGNIPLSASREGRLDGRVGRRGIEDARRVASELRALSNVRRVLISPKPRFLPELPIGLAASLGAEVFTAERTNG